MGRQRRGSGIMTKAWGTNHDSIISPPIKARTMEQRRSSNTSAAHAAKNIARPFLSNVTNWKRYRARHK